MIAALVCGTATAQTENDTLTVASFTIRGAEHVDTGALKDVLATRESSWLPWRDKARFDPMAFQVDLRRIVAYYRDRGFPDARVASHDVTVRPGSTEVDIVVRVEEGEPTIVEGVTLDGFDVLAANRVAALRDNLPLTAGDIAVRAQIVAGQDLATVALKNEGYAYAKVRVEEEMIAPMRVRIRYTTEPGVRAIFGPIDVAGNASVSDDIVKRHLTYRPGDLYRLDRARASQRRLYGLELFQFATIDTLESGERASVPTRVTVAEGKHRRVRLSAGWGTEEKVRGEASWRHVNFYGGARVLAVHGKWSSLDSGSEADFTQPYLFHPNLSLSLNAHALYADELAYRARSEGGRASINGRLSDTSRWSVTYTHELARSEVSNQALTDLSLRDTLIALGLDPTSGRQDGVLSSIEFSAERTTTENPLNPQRGYSVRALLEQAGTVLPGDFNYASARVDLRAYVPLSGRVVLAGRAHAATIDPAGDAADVPFFKRYFLGGSTSLRGWGRFEVAPLSAAGLPLGGFSLFETSGELRTRVWKSLGLVLFVDAGDVWDRPWEYRLGDVRVDVGPGLRYQTPVGPVRADWAYQLTPIPGLLVEGDQIQRRWRIHFSIGQSF